MTSTNPIAQILPSRTDIICTYARTHAMVWSHSQCEKRSSLGFPRIAIQRQSHVPTMFSMGDFQHHRTCRGAQSISWHKPPPQNAQQRHSLYAARSEVAFDSMACILTSLGIFTVDPLSHVLARCKSVLPPAIFHILIIRNMQEHLRFPVILYLVP